MNEKWFTRGPQAVVDETYLKNMVQATQFFMRWLKCDGGFSFRAMLKHMHRLVSHNYQGHTKGNYILKSSDDFRGQPNTTWHPVLKKRWFTGIGDEQIIRPALPYVTPKMSHYLENTDEGYVLHLPDSKYVSFYLTRMEVLMSSLARKRLLDLDVLVAYIQLFVIGHPFEKINFSICMAQVNAILYINGLEPIYHGWLDFECFMYDYDRLMEIFLAKVSDVNRNNIN